MAKKQIANYLSNRDYRNAEAMYAAMKSYPGFHMPNIFTYRTREFYAVYEQMAREFSRANRSKYRSHNSLSVAAHEAGHAVVGAASCLEVHKATIIPKGKWAGFVSYSPEGESAPELGELPALEGPQPMPDQVNMRRELLTDAAGFVAEHDRLDRYSTSYHEKLIVYFQTRYLDEQQGQNRLTNWHHFTSWTSRIIKENSSLFDMALADILTNKDLSENGKQILNNTATTQDINLFFN